MIETLKTVKNYETIEKDVKFLPKSLIRLRILKMLYDCPRDMKEMNHETKFHYSAISTHIHGLELNGQVYKENNRYFLSNSMKLQMDNLLKINNLMNLLEIISPILQGHKVMSIPRDCVENIHYLDNIELIESSGFDVYKAYEFIEKSLLKAKSVNAILPFSYNEFNMLFNRLSKRIDIDLMIPEDIKDILLRNLDTSKSNLRIGYFNGDEAAPFLLICTDEKVILGFFKDDGTYDQNRLLTSEDDDCIIWGNELFKNFKKENIKMSH